mmetsp:Transcript_27825/g.47300  ORF Transcript_27825/g.47300 Transcript_27825/m.47300 type:complete len:404 (+) Transcript_27825:118-1329(+)|eukprot:CAMPEP_0183732924 /NCGR_PEP_ID=MMETSP0737-20130205/39705_1 /TAXON_ID=385413 /ORGANISM="Thalassiosira miniscula, Strain CCMP1093" /LENGTH=403 /DNA_ID=CAMNT_0025966065 /DNA_START=102 /DNA_END=1313 /DNA_ORIENTATION=+
MAAEAFDPFANDDDEQFVHNETHVPPTIVVSPRRTTAPVVASPRDTPRTSSRSSPRGSSKGIGETRIQKHVGDDDIMKEFDAAFPSMTLDDSEMDQFGFPSSFPTTFEFPPAPSADADETNTSTTKSKGNPAATNLEGVTFVVAEEMTVIHKSKNNQCSVKVRGKISLEKSSHSHPSQQIDCDLSLVDPQGHLDTTTSKNLDFVQPMASADEFTSMKHTNTVVSNTAFRISMPEFNGGPLIDYTCGDNLRPVPMLISTNIQEFNDHCQIMFQLRVNPRNVNSLLNAVVIVAVPDEFDGEMAEVCSVGRTIGKGNIDTNWSGITRILSWTLGELYSGAICEFEALLPRSASQTAKQTYGAEETKFPVLLRYDSEGSVLSDIDLDFADGLSPSMKKKFRVYHREI